MLLCNRGLRLNLYQKAYTGRHRRHPSNTARIQKVDGFHSLVLSETPVYEQRKSTRSSC